MIQHISFFIVDVNCCESLLFHITNNMTETPSATAKANIKNTLKLFVKYKKAIIVDTLKKHMKAKGLFLNSSIIMSPY